MTNPTTRASRVRGLRAGWLTTSLLALGSAALPWSCGTSALAHAGRWAGAAPPGPVFAMGVALPIVLLTLTSVLESRELPLRVARAALAAVLALACVALAIAAFGERLAPQGFRVGRDVQLECPAPIALFHGAARAALQIALVAPALAFGAWGLAVNRGSSPALALRALAAHAVVSIALVWAPYCDGVGWIVGVAAGAMLSVTAPLVPDTGSATRVGVRRALALAACAVFLVQAAIALPQRGGFQREMRHAVDAGGSAR